MDQKIEEKTKLEDKIDDVKAEKKPLHYHNHTIIRDSFNENGIDNSDNNNQAGFSGILKTGGRLRRAKLPHFEISRGIIGTILFLILFCSLIIWFIRDFEDDQSDLNHFNNSSNQTDLAYHFEYGYKLPIQYVLALTALIVIIIVGSVFLFSIAHHVKAKKERITLKTFKSENLKDIFASHRTQHRTPLYYLNQDMSNSLKHNNENI